MSSEPVEVAVDDSLAGSAVELPALEDGVPRLLGAMENAAGDRLEFVLNEVVLETSDPAQLQAFLDAYGGEVLRDGRPLSIEGSQRAHGAGEPSGFYLIRVDPARSTLNDLEENVRALGMTGELRFSSDAAARLAALLAREAHTYELSGNVLFSGDAEHPDDAGGNVDVESMFWMTEDDDPSTPGDQGLSSGVVHAWEYLEYQNTPPRQGTYIAPTLAIIDSGFALDPDTGAPLLENIDYNHFGPAPRQGNLMRRGRPAAGENTMKCGGKPCPWHGQGAFGVALAYPRNNFGTAGTGADVGYPLLLRVDGSAYMIADAIRSAAHDGADVISISLSNSCKWAPFFCSLEPEDMYSVLKAAVRTAVGFGSQVIASAGNARIDLGDDDILPCETSGLADSAVICVGGVGPDKRNRFNFGRSVDIWAPVASRTTVTPLSAALDANDVGIDELQTFGGTSAAAPFVAGVVLLMKALDPELRTQQILPILQATANPSPDPLVTRGYVDAFRAVQAVRPNRPPELAFTGPDPSFPISWKGAQLSLNVRDPEVDAGEEWRYPSTVTFRSDLQGELCRVTAFPYACLSGELMLGTHEITASAVDAFGASASVAQTFEVVNRAPELTLNEPRADGVYYAHQPIPFAASVYDPDEPLSSDGIAWSSSLDGALGTGSPLRLPLSEGVHEIEAEVVDGRGVVAQAQVFIRVLSGAGLPAVTISAANQSGNMGQFVILEGSATDPEDGALSGASLVWSSDIDGVLGTGSRVEVELSGPPEPCEPEILWHTIVLTATDSDGNAIEEIVRVGVGVVC